MGSSGIEGPGWTTDFSIGVRLACKGLMTQLLIAYKEKNISLGNNIMINESINNLSGSP